MQIVRETKSIVPKRYGKQSGLTRQTVTKFVNILIKEDKVIKYGNKYFVADDIVDDGRFEFAKYLESLLIMGHIATVRIRFDSEDSERCSI